ncbi:hypothetical protein L1887_53234 [Cichorium endivia]|nr:hypothetical protein L1887_53234 [Cichorium endivia]
MVSDATELDGVLELVVPENLSADRVLPGILHKHLALVALAAHADDAGREACDELVHQRRGHRLQQLDVRQQAVRGDVDVLDRHRGHLGHQHAPDGVGDRRVHPDQVELARGVRQACDDELEPLAERGEREGVRLARVMQGKVAAGSLAMLPLGCEDDGSSISMAFSGADAAAAASALDERLEPLDGIVKRVGGGAQVCASAGESRGGAPVAASCVVSSGRGSKRDREPKASGAAAAEASCATFGSGVRRCAAEPKKNPSRRSLKEAAKVSDLIEHTDLNPEIPVLQALSHELANGHAGRLLATSHPSTFSFSHCIDTALRITPPPMEGINADTKLESLTDAQRLELAEKVRAESTAGQPLISSVEPIEVLEHEYANNDAFLGKIQWLKEAGFIETKELNEHALVEAMNDAEQSNSIVVYLRLLTSAFLKLNADEYTPFLFSLDTHTDAAAPDMQSFCANHVEAIGKEADHVQITALSRALKVSLDVAYLSPAQAPPATPLDEDFPAEQIQSSEHNAQSSNSIPVPGNEAASRRHAADNPNRCDVVRFEVEGGQITEIGTMLLRPGHYDLLVQAPTPASPEPEIPAILST